MGGCCGHRPGDKGKERGHIPLIFWVLGAVLIIGLYYGLNGFR